MNGLKLKAKATENGYTLKRLAAEIGISHNTMYLKVKGDREFTIFEVERMCEVLGISTIDEFRSVFFT